MEAKVGARLEVVPRRQWLAWPDVGLLLVLIILSVGLHAWLIRHTFVTARDSLGFARLALNFETPTATLREPKPDGKPWTWLDVLRSSEHPPGYASSVLMMSYGVRPLHSAPLAEQMLLSCQLASALAGVLLVVPIYLIGRLLFGRFTGFAAALLFQVLPVPAHITSDGLAEALYLLCVSVALYFGMRAIRRRSVLNSLFCGAATGLSYLVRPEGLMVILAVGAVVAGLGILHRWPRDVAMGRLLALAVGVIVVSTPYMLLIGGLTNKSASGELLRRLIPNSPRTKLGAWDQSLHRTAPPPVLLAAWYQEGDEKFQWAAQAVGSEVLKASHFAPAALAAIGLVLLRRRLFSDPALAVLPVLLAINLSVLYALGLKIGYVSERHTLLVVLVICYFAAATLEPVGRVIPGGQRFGAIGLLIALVASAIPSAIRPLHENRAGHYHAGHYLAAVVTPHDVVIDPFCWAEFYSGRSLYAVPPDPPDAAVIYAIVESTKDAPHSRLPRYDLAVNVAQDGWSQVVYRWPIDGSVSRKGVMVVKLDRSSQDAVRAIGSGAVSPFLNRRVNGSDR